MRVRYGGFAATLSLVFGIVALVFTPLMASIALGEPAFVVGPLTIVGAALVLGGLLMLRGSAYVTVEADRFVLHALVGPIKRTFQFASWRDVEYAGGTLWVTFEGKRKRVPVHRGQANGADWLAFERYLLEHAGR